MTNTINLIKPKSVESPILVKWRGMIKSVTTVVLAIWVIVCAGYLGWRVYMNSKTERVSLELDGLIAQAEAKSKEEIVIRKIDVRAKSVNEFLDNRGEIIKKLEVLLEATPEAFQWTFNRVLDSQSVQVKATTASGLDEYLQVLNKYYQNVKVISIAKAETDLQARWTMTANFGGWQQ